MCNFRLLSDQGSEVRVGREKCNFTSFDTIVGEDPAKKTSARGIEIILKVFELSFSKCKLLCVCVCVCVCDSVRVCSLLLLPNVLRANIALVVKIVTKTSGFFFGR